eukprot:364281-Chlamydomonas_euryale.AAC.3
MAPGNCGAQSLPNPSSRLLAPEPVHKANEDTTHPLPPRTPPPPPRPPANPHLHQAAVAGERRRQLQFAEECLEAPPCLLSRGLQPAHARAAR